MGLTNPPIRRRYVTHADADEPFNDARSFGIYYVRSQHSLRRQAAYMARYWWQCISCGDRPAWLTVCHSRSIAAFIWDELAPSGWDQRLLRRRCKCNVSASCPFTGTGLAHEERAAVDGRALESDSSGRCSSSADACPRACHGYEASAALTCYVS